MPTQQPRDDYGATLQELLHTLQESTRNTTEERRQLAQKMDDLARTVNDVRREQQTAIDGLRRDFERLFVPLAKYDPERQAILDKLRDYDAIISRSSTYQEEYVRYKAKVDEIKVDLEEAKTHQAGWSSRVIPWVSLLLTVAGIVVLYAQHFTFHP